MNYSIQWRARFVNSRFQDLYGGPNTLIKTITAERIASIERDKGFIQRGQ
jgi:hypothetical protein